MGDDLQSRTLLAQPPSEAVEDYEETTRLDLTNYREVPEFVSALFEIVQILAVNLANSGNINMGSFDRDLRNGAALYRDMGDDYRARMYDLCADNIAKMVRIKAASDHKG